MNKVTCFLLMALLMLTTQSLASALLIEGRIFDNALQSEIRDNSGLSLPKLPALAERNIPQLATPIASTKKRYTYKLTLVNFTPQEVDIVSSMVLSRTDNVNTILLDEKTKMHFLGLFLPSKEITFELSTFLSPSQFREQMSLLFERMNVEVSSTFIHQDNLFISTRAVSAYSMQLVIFWGALIILVLLLTFLAFWSWVQFKLNVYESNNQSAKWIRFVHILRLIPLPFLCRNKWHKQLSYWQKRVSQADIWFDNAQQLLQNNEIEAAHIFVKRALESNASNMTAQALEVTIAEQLSKHQAIQNDREQFKKRVSKAVELAHAGKGLAALEQAYKALELCQRQVAVNGPSIDLQIESTKNLIQGISAKSGQRCEGIILASGEQKIHINCAQSMRIGRSSPKAQSDTSADVTLPQDTLSRVHKSIIIARQPNGFTIQDLGSTNGMWLQYRECENNKEYILAEMDQIHLSPPDELGSIGFQVRHIGTNQSIALGLCQNAILPAVNFSSAKSFLNPSEYADHRWYLSNENFYLVCSLNKYIWYSESQWQVSQTQKITQEEVNEVLKIELKGEVYLHLCSQTFDVRIDNTRILGSVPLPLKSQLSVNGFVIDLILIAAQAVDKSVKQIPHD
jgi:hypothetical protein